MPGHPQSIANILSELLARRGLGRVQASAVCEEAWRQAAGELLAGHSRVGAVQRGVLQVLVDHSLLVQEIGFQKIQLLAELNRLLPEARIRDLRVRVGRIE